jgi:SAM-dependent methyltransferase
MRGENAMEWARQNSPDLTNSAVAVLIAYDLQSGSYISAARKDHAFRKQWTEQLADILNAFVEPSCSLLEVGCGEATTLSGVLDNLVDYHIDAFGFDISWSRIAHGLAWLAENSASARLFVADLFEIPLADNSVDVVYTSHSIEPNGGREREAISELLRVSRRGVVLIEPIYELADEPARRRMEHHGYVRGLKGWAESLGGKVADYRLLPITANPLNPSGVLVIEKDRDAPIRGGGIAWRCPLTHVPLHQMEDVFCAKEAGIIYPVLRGIPMLRTQHSIVASAIADGI